MKLIDPSKAAHEIINDPKGDDDAIRNDGVVLQAANKNKWYVLATIYGEQPEGAAVWDRDEALAVRNLRAWNGWFCGGLSTVDRNECREATGLSSEMVAPLTEAEVVKLRKNLRARLSDDAAELPDPSEAIDFSDTYFPRLFYLNQYVFESSIDFRSAWFSGPVVFGSTLFRSHVDFSSAWFNNSASFMSASLRGSAIFSAASFCRNASFSSVLFSDFTDFTSVLFNGEIDFNEAKFKSATFFGHACFLTHVPEFHGADLFDDMEFPTRADDLGNWPPVSGVVELEGYGEPVEVMDAEAQKRAYNRLRLFMNRSLQIDEEQFFHRMEMRCKRETEDWRYRWIYTLFEGVSDYGNSVLRPAGWLFVVWLAGVWAKLEAVSGGWWPDYHSIPSAMGWSFANLFSFFGFYRKYFHGEDLNAVLQLFSGVQTVLGFALLFMLGLGLRNRFRLR